MKPKLLDLFCGAGGASMGYYRAGFALYGIDNKPQPHYPFPFLQMDALEAMDRLLRGEGLTFSNGETLYLSDFAAFHASPPCQHYTMMQNIVKRRDAHPDLIAPTRDRLIATGKPYVIENVYKAPLRGHLMLCGTMFGLRIIRHRFFECPWMNLTLLPSCNHSDVYDPWHGKGNADEFRRAMGIDWMLDVGGGHKNGGSRSGTLSEAIPPAYTEYIGKYLLQVINEKVR